MGSVPVWVAAGDRIGPEILSAVTDAGAAASASLAFQPVRLGLEVPGEGASSGVDPAHGGPLAARRGGATPRGRTSSKHPFDGALGVLDGAGA
jgi:hypothetical protein